MLSYLQGAKQKKNYFKISIPESTFPLAVFSYVRTGASILMTAPAETESYEHLCFEKKCYLICKELNNKNFASRSMLTI